jgi:regulator of replication initiation timing
MTETLLQKLEEKMMLVLTEVESSREQLKKLLQENATLRFEKESYTQKLQGLVSLLETMNLVDTTIQNTNATLGKPMLVQG